MLGTSFPGGSDGPTCGLGPLLPRRASTQSLISLNPHQPTTNTRRDSGAVVFVNHGKEGHQVGKRTRGWSSSSTSSWGRTALLLLAPAVILVIFFFTVYGTSQNCQKGMGFFATEQMDWSLPEGSNEPLTYLDHRFVSISSDDWGRWTDAVCVWPNASEIHRFEEMGYVTQHPVWRLAAAESAEDINSFFAFMDGLNKGLPYAHRAVISPMWVVGGPDIEAMKETGCPHSEECAYREFLISDGAGPLARKPYFRGDLRPLYWKGFQQGIWHPEYHGRSHLSVKKWMYSLKRDNWTQILFEEGYACVDGTHGYTYLRSELTDFEEESEATLINWIKGGVRSFEAFWGYSPKVCTVPHTTADPRIGRVFETFKFYGIDQLNISKTSGLSEIDRFRLDAYYVDYDLNERLASMRESLSQEQFLVLMWHTQNTLTSTYSPSVADEILGSFRRTVEFLRTEVPDVVFVTSSELHQIRRRGWSREIWPDYLVYRNYNNFDVRVQVPDLGELFPGQSKQRHRWIGFDLRVQSCKTSDQFCFVDPLAPMESGKWGHTVHVVGDFVRIKPDMVVIVRAFE